MSIPTPSEEQTLAINHIIAGDNVILDAVAGSGKSTTILSMSQIIPKKRVLQITYNAMLRKEIQTKIGVFEIKNVKVHTFHSLAVRYYLKSAYTDTGIRKIVLDDMRPLDKIASFDIIVLDEAQDMSFLYFQFIVKFIADMSGNNRFQLFVLGDFMQGIYEFKGSDVRFITQASHIWKNNFRLLSREFHQCTLKTSYRITRQMARFVNDVMLGETRLEAQKDGPEVFYMRHKSRYLENMAISQIAKLMAEGASAGDFFIIGASVKGVNSNIRKMENALVGRGIPCYVPMFDTEGFDDKVIEGKIVFSTIHSVKGRERKYVIVMGFDQSYFHFASGIPVHYCPNTLYVACTRATHRLFLLEKDDFSTDRPLEFLKKTHHQIRDEKYAEFKGTPRVIFYAMNPSVTSVSSSTDESKDKFTDVSPTELVRYVSENVLETISELLSSIFIQESEPREEIEIPNTILTSRGFYEDVSDLNGIAIPSMYYDHLFRLYSENGISSKLEEAYANIGTNVLKHVINECLCDTKDHEHLTLKGLIDKIPDCCETASDYLRLSNLYVAAKERLLFKWHQIDDQDYNWVTNELEEQCLTRLDDIIGAECEEEFPLVERAIIDREMEVENEKIHSYLSPYFPNAVKKFRFSARADLITAKTIFELKCTSSITIEHKLQVILYRWLWEAVHTPDLLKKRNAECVDPREVRIVNIKTGEILRLNAAFDDLTTIVVELLRGKYDPALLKNDADFEADCESVIKKYNFASLSVQDDEEKTSLTIH